MQSQFSQLDSGDGIVSEGILHDNIRNITFRRNVIINVAANSNIGMPGVRFESNTFYRTAYELSGINIGGSLTRGDPSRTALRNNVFLAGGARASTVDDFSGYYALSGGVFLREVIAVFVTRERDASGAISLSGPIAQALFDDVTKNGYIDGNGNLQARARELTDISKFVLNDQYSLYRQALYNYLVKTVQLDNAIRSTFVADYNFVAGAEAAGFPSKRDSGCISGSSYTRWNFCEPHGVNGGDPLLPNLANPLGPDGIPFTLDDGLKPLPTSPLCGRGEGGTDIGAYSCDPSKVFASSAPPQAPQNLKIVR